MPFVPAILVPVGDRGALLFLSGATAVKLYHRHPHVPEDFELPNDMSAQTRMALDNVWLSLDAVGATWTNVVRMTKYLTDIREQDEMNVVLSEVCGGHLPTSTTVEVSHLVVPGAKLEIEVTAWLPEYQPGTS